MNVWLHEYKQKWKPRVRRERASGFSLYECKECPSWYFPLHHVRSLKVRRTFTGKYAVLSQKVSEITAVQQKKLNEDGTTKVQLRGIVQLFSAMNHSGAAKFCFFCALRRIVELFSADRSLSNQSANWSSSLFCFGFFPRRATLFCAVNVSK